MTALSPGKASGETPVMGRGLTFAMAVATGVAVANIYYNQPLLGLMERDLPGRLTTLIPTVTQLGYATGLFLLVPLGDLVERKRLIASQFVVLALALAAAAAAPDAALLLLAFAVVGAGASVAQQIVPLAAHFASPERRGATVGMVMSGLLCGILFSRTLAGFIGTHGGWREMFWLSVPVALVMAGLMAIILPRSEPEGGLGYGELLRSLAGLWREFGALRRATMTQACLFGTFSVFWTILALHLQEPRFGLGADVAGLFGIAGAVGILAAPLAGRLADKSGPHRIIGMGSLLALVSWVIMGLWDSIPGLILGVILIDFAVQSVLVSHQHIVYALRPEARSRINTLFMGGMFLGGAAGSAIAVQAWAAGGWPAVAVFGGLLGGLAFLLQRGGAGRRVG